MAGAGGTMPNNCRAAGGVPSRTVTCEEGPLPADREEEVVRNAVGSQVLTPEQGRAAFIVSRLTRTPVADVLRQNGVTRDSVVDALDEEARDTFIPGYRIIAK